MRTFTILALAFFSTVAIAKNDLDIEAKPPIHVRPEATTSPQGYAPSQIRHAYGIDTLSQTGAGQIIAIVDAYGDPTLQSDLNTFSTKFGLPLTTVRFLYPQGVPRKTDGGWALETALDAEWAHAIAPAATLLVVVTTNSSLSNLLAGVTAAVNAGASQVSMSWGANEFSSESSYDSYFNVPGVSFTAASGDSGAGVIWPAASPFVTSVGGTTLTLDASGNVTNETAWSGSGGGQSAYYPEPSYQTNFQTTGKRGVPDVAYDADPNTGFSVYMSTAYQGRKGWFVVGGTSAGAPQMAAIIALANSARATSLPSALAAFYQLNYVSNAYFNDIIFGCNVTNGGVAPYTCASTGYDFVTGIGSPRGGNLVSGLVSF